MALMSAVDDAIRRISHALGRPAPPDAPPRPPDIDEHIARLVHTELGLSELFARMAADECHMDVECIAADDLAPALASYIGRRSCRRIGLADSPLLDSLGVYAALRQAGLNARPWAQLTLDEAYDLDCGVTDVYAAVAETGSIVIRPWAGHGRALSLVPPLHIAIVHPKDIVADLIDLMDKLRGAPAASAAIIISGPSKTADIEMTLVHGVHGPETVKVYLLR